ncbi:MAG: HDIG domain-containing protein, partial [Candidatus Bathyarchaeia archaeon]
HDIGRAYTHDVHHGLRGARILRSVGVAEKVVRIVESHVGAGIPEEEAKNIGLPPKDYIPQTAEEKIVCYADKLISGERVISFKQALKEMERCLGSGHPALKRLTRLREEILQFTGGKDFASRFDGKNSK